MARLLLSAILVIIGVSLVYSITIDTLNDNTGTSDLNIFCACNYNNHTCYTNLAAKGATVLGNSRAQLLIPTGQNINATTTSWTSGCKQLWYDYINSISVPDPVLGNRVPTYDDYCSQGLSTFTGCPATGCTGQYGLGGELGYSTPVGSTSFLYTIWNGECPTSVQDINYSGLGGVDITDAGISDSFNILIGEVDISTLLLVQIWTDSTHGSNATFDPSIFALSANYGGAFTRVTLPFQTFTVIPGAVGPADFTHVGCVMMIVQASGSVDLDLALIQTAGTLELTKSMNITSDSSDVGVANPLDIITYSMVLAYAGLGSAVTDVWFWDDPSLDIPQGNISWPYYNLVPGSLSAQLFQIDVNTDARVPISGTYVEINGPNVMPQLKRVVLYFGDISTETEWHVSFQIQIPASLPCCLPTCQLTCTGLNGESCYCIANTAYFCAGSDSVNLNSTDSSGNQPNFTTTFVTNNCGYTTSSQTVDGVTATTRGYTLTPIYAPASPYVAFTSTLPSTAVAAQVINVPFFVANNGTRDITGTVTLTYPASLLTVSGSTGAYTCSSGSCVYSNAALTAGSNLPTSLSFSVNPVTGCGSAPAIFTLAVAPIGCSTASATTGSCKDINTADNMASSNTVNITGSPSLSLSMTSTSTSISPGGSAPLSICYQNTGLSTATGVTITVTLPSGFSGSSSGSWTCSGTSCTYNVGSIASGTTACTALPVLTVTWNVATLGCTTPTLNFAASLSSPCGSASSSVTIAPTATTAISLTKTGPATAVVGSSVTFSLSYTNNGSRTYDSITITETVPTNTVYSGTGWTCTGAGAAGSTCSISINPVTPQTPVTFTVTILANTPCSVPSITNTASAVGTCASNPAFTTGTVTASATVPITGNPDLFVTKTATDGNGNAVTSVSSGQSVTYVINYGNRGNRITNAVITESAVGSPFTFSGPSGTWSSPDANGLRTYSLTNLAPGQNGTVTFVVASSATLATCTTPPVPNTVSIATSAPCVETNLADNSATVTVAVSATSDLYVRFVALTSTPVVPTQTTANLQFCYGNLGNSGVSNASMTVTLPSGLTASSTGNSGWVISGSQATIFIGAVSAQATEACRTLVVNLPSTLGCFDTGFNGTVMISGECTESNYTNNQAPWNLPVTATYDLYVTKSAPVNASFKQSAPVVVYSINYGNNGGRSVGPVVLIDTLPQYTTFVAASSDARWVSSGNGAYSINLGTVNANSNSPSAVLFAVSINLPIPSAVKLVTNYVYINMTGSCPAEVNLVNNNASAVVPVVGNPDVWITKTDFGVSFFGNSTNTSPGARFSGDVVVYTLSYGNDGDSDANNVTITETVPLNTVFDTLYSSSGWSCADGAAAMSTCTINVGAVPIAANGAKGVVYGTRNFAVRATPFSPSTYNQAVRCGQPATQNVVNIAVGSDQVDLNQTNNNAMDTTPFAGLPNLSIIKTDDVGGDQSKAKRAGDVIYYTFTYQNTGVREATNVVIVDTIPQYTIYNSLYSAPGWICANGGLAGTNCTYSISSIAPGQNTTAITLAVTVQTGFPASVTCVTNNVFIDNGCGESYYPDNYDYVCTPVTGFFDLILQKHGYCETILYQLSYTNVGTIGARDVYLKTYIPVDSTFNANNSAPGWNCSAPTPGSECLLAVTDPTDSTDFLAPGAGGTADFAVDPYPSSMSATFTLDSSIDDNWTGDNLDPTPDNNRASTTVGFSGCATCDSCCPPVDTCCPDYTDVAFNFGGVLDGIKTCS